MCYQAVNPPDVFYQGENMIVIKCQQFDFSFFNAGDIEKWIAGRNKVAEKYNDINKYRSNKIIHSKNTKTYLQSVVI